MPGAEGQPQTLYDKVLQAHIVDEKLDGTVLLYIGWFPSMTRDTRNSKNLTLPFTDRHLVHEVTSPQAFEGLEKAGRQVRRPDCTLATTDHVR